MQPFASLSELPRQLQQDAVRELAWTLLATPLLDAPAASVRHPLTASDWAARPERLADWLLQLDRQPQPLLDWLARQPIHRLGHHYERLWQFAALAAPGVELLGHNLAVREGNRTLGELDLLLRDAEGIQPIELAVKFYLGLPSAAHAPRWYGPDPRDRLDLKLGHLYRQQLPLAGLAAYVSWRWGITRTMKAWILAMLHIGFAWLSVSLLIYGVHSLLLFTGNAGLGLVPLHVLMLGFIGTMLLPMATRVTLGHSGHPLTADRPTWILFWLYHSVVLVRVAAELWLPRPGHGYLLAALLWLACLGWWYRRYARIYLIPRVDGAPG